MIYSHHLHEMELYGNMDRLDLQGSLLRNRRHPGPHPAEPSIPGIIDVYARWVRYDGGRPTGPKDFFQKTYVYAVTIPPSEPLALGRRVRVLVTTPASWVPGPDADPNLHGANDAHVVGTVTNVLGWKGKLVALAVENECRQNLVRRARLEIPYLPNVTVVPETLRLREGRGPKVAGLDDLDLSARVQPLQSGWSCNAGHCMLRLSMPMTVRPGVFAVLLFGGVGLVEQGKEHETQQEEPAKKRKQLGKMAAVGWKGKEG